VFESLVLVLINFLHSSQAALEIDLCARLGAGRGRMQKNGVWVEQ